MLTKDLIETFLAVYECHNITAASHKLYSTQGTVSHRIALLEQEVGITLFERHRGKRSLSVTPAGEEFVSLAYRWMALFEDTESVGSLTHRTGLTIAGNDLSFHVFMPLYHALVERHQEIRLRIRSHHSEEVYALMEARQVDIGLAYNRMSYPDVIVRPLFREEMLLVTSSESPYEDGVEPDELPAEQEVYLNWSANYAVWHNTHWRPRSYLMHASTGVQALSFLDVPGRWAIVPWSIFESRAKDSGLVLRRLAERPPDRTCYLLTQRSQLAESSAAVTCVLDEMHSYVDDLIAADTSIRAPE